MTTATEHDLDVTITLPGSEPVHTTLDGMQRASESLGGQLSFDVGGQRPSQITLAVGGKIAVHSKLLKGQRVVVHILDDNGEIIADAPGTVTAIAFVDKTDKEGFVTTTREQKITLDA